MKQSLQLRLSQQLNLTPQLQQAIKLLQLSRMELEAEIRKEMTENPVLEDGMEESNKDLAAEAEANPQPEQGDPDPRKGEEFEWDSYFESQNRNRERVLAGH